MVVHILGRIGLGRAPEPARCKTNRQTDRRRKQFAVRGHQLVVAVRDHRTAGARHGRDSVVAEGDDCRSSG